MSDDPLEDYYAEFKPGGKPSYNHLDYKLATGKITLGEYAIIRDMQENGIADDETRRPLPLSAAALPGMILN